MSHAIVPALSGYWQEAIRACAGTRLSARPELPINTGMGQQEGNHEATGPGESAQGSEGHSLACCLDELLRALDLHRLCFLFFAEAHRVNPRFVGGETVKKPKLFGEIRKKGVDDRGEFLLRYRDEIGQFAEATINDFGYGKGQKPIEPYDEETWGEVKGGSYPRWTVYRQDIGWLQKTSDKVVETCARLSHAQSSDEDGQIVGDTLRAVWPHGAAKWYAARSIPWDYLEGIDTIITLVKEAIVKTKDITTRVDRRGAKSTEGSGPNGVDTRTKRKRATKIERRQHHKTAASDEERDSEFRVADGAGNGLQANTSGTSTVNVQNANNVVLGNVQQNQNLVSGDHSPAGGEASTSQPNKKNVKRIITSVSLLAAVLTVLQVLFGWIEAIWHLLTRR